MSSGLRLAAEQEPEQIFRFSATLLTNRLHAVIVTSTIVLGRTMLQLQFLESNVFHDFVVPALLRESALQHDRARSCSGVAACGHVRQRFPSAGGFPSERIQRGLLAWCSSPSGGACRRRDGFGCAPSESTPPA